MSPTYQGRTASADDVVQHETSTLTCPNGHVWRLNPASIEIDEGKTARCWAPACNGAPLTGVTAETESRRALAARLHEAVVDSQRGQLHLVVES